MRTVEFYQYESVEDKAKGLLQLVAGVGIIGIMLLCMFLCGDHVVDLPFSCG